MLCVLIIFTVEPRMKITLASISCRNYSMGRIPQESIDSLNAGYYVIRVFDAGTNSLIFSFGFSTLFNQWQTTKAALDGLWKTIHETVVIPYQKTKLSLSFGAVADEYYTNDVAYSVFFHRGSSRGRPM